MANEDKKDFNAMLHDSKDMPKFQTITDKKSIEKYGGSKMYFAPPIDYDKVMKQIPYGKVITIGEIREHFAKLNGADFTEPITAGIFVSIAAWASYQRSEEETPYWRTRFLRYSIDRCIPAHKFADWERSIMIKVDMKMDVKKLSGKYTVKKLHEADIDKILELCSGNKLFFEYHPPFATRESISEDMAALPPGKEDCDKYYAGYYEGDSLVAVVDLILDYPHKKTAFVGFFMVDISYQGQNIGSFIIAEMADYLKKLGFEKIRLAIDEGNPQSDSFWTKNHFGKTGERQPNDFSAYLPMERVL